MAYRCAPAGVFCRALSCTTSFPELGFAVCHLRCRLFPEPLFSSLKSGNSPSAQTVRIFTFTSQMLFIGNNLRLDGTPLRSSRCFLKVAVLHYFLSGVGVCGMPSALPLISRAFVQFTKIRELTFGSNNPDFYVHFTNALYRK